MKMDIEGGVKDFVKPFRITKGKDFQLKSIDPGDTRGLSIDKQKARDLLNHGVERLAELQEMLYAQDCWALLVVLQAMDAAGKDGVIKHVMSGVNPQGCEVTSFKAPTSVDLDHDYLWRSCQRLPQRGRIGIFNRSYYEEVLIVRVHQQLLHQQRLPKSLVTKDIWTERFEDINGFERYLARNGIVLCKIFLHLSKEEQKQRFLARIEDSAKNWKFSASDMAERRYWDDYQRAYEDMIRRTSAKHAPWHVIPADNKWFTRLVVAAAIIHTLQGLNLAYPKLSADAKKQIAEARALLLQES